jgi:hypothetical protein
VLDYVCGIKNGNYERELKMTQTHEQKRLERKVRTDLSECFIREPEIDDTVHCCPECEAPNQFGELCDRCRREEEAIAERNSDCDFFAEYGYYPS